MAGRKWTKEQREKLSASIRAKQSLRTVVLTEDTAIVKNDVKLFVKIGNAVVPVPGRIIKRKKGADGNVTFLVQIGDQ